MKQTKPFGVVTKQGKHVGQKLLNHYAIKAEKDRPTDRFLVSYGTIGLVEPLYNPETLAKLLEINTYHYRACKTKARDAAGLGWSLVPRDSDAEDVETPAALSAWMDSLDPPLPMILDQAQLDYETIGWACIELVREDYKPDGPFTEMIHLPAHTIRIHKDNKRYVQQRGTKTVWFKRVEHDKDVNKDTGAESGLGELEPEQRATELLMWRNYTPRSAYYGLPDVLPALGAIHGDLARRDYNIAFFDNFGVPAYAVFITGDFDDEDDDGVITDPEADTVAGDASTQTDDRSSFEATIEEHFQELAKNPHSTLILAIPGKDVNIEFKPLAVDVKEASFRLYRMDNRDEILAAHGVPPYRAGIAETGSLGGSTAQESTEIYKASVIEPRQSMLEHLINRYIVRSAFNVQTHEWKLDQIDTTDESHDMDMLERLVNIGAVTPEEVRALWADRFGLTKDAPLPATPEPLEDAPLEVLEAVAAQAFERALKERDERSIRLVQG